MEERISSSLAKIVQINKDSIAEFTADVANSLGEEVDSYVG